MDINYTIQFFSDWHCGSGLAAGADVDLLVVKDINGLPYVPGKTMKGLVREAVEDIFTFRGKDKSTLVACFGNAEDRDNDIHNADSKMQKGAAYFANAELPDGEAGRIISEQLQPYLYRSISATAIDDNGIAKEHSLRKMQVVVPCTLKGSILDVPDELAGDVKDGLRMIKRLGQNRNRGLGRCDITIINQEGGKQ